MNVLHLHNVVSVELSTIRTINTEFNNSFFHVRDLIVRDDKGVEIRIALFSNGSPEQLAIQEQV